ncbi:hypothetical protein ADK38_39140, partial [Streptomyces varsoviensis]
MSATRTSGRRRCSTCARSPGSTRRPPTTGPCSTRPSTRWPRRAPAAGRAGGAAGRGPRPRGQ